MQSNSENKKSDLLPEILMQETKDKVKDQSVAKHRQFNVRNMTERTKNSLCKTEVLNAQKQKKISILFKNPLNIIT